MKLINSIDNYFYSKALKDTVMIFVMILVLLAFIVFYLIYPKVHSYKLAQETKYHNSLNTLMQLRTQKLVLNSKIVFLNKQIKNIILKKTALKKQKDFYDELANLMDFIQFNKYKWGKFVKELVVNAKKEGLKVNSFTNKLYTKNKGLINKKMDIILNVSGGYKNFLYFIYQYENRRDLLRVENIQLDSNKNFKVKFTLYGYEQ